MDFRPKEEMQNQCVVNMRTEQCCGEHRKRLELFCQEDEAFICVLCVPRHSSHSFLFLHEALSVYKDKLKTALSSLELKFEHLKDQQKTNEKELLDIHDDAYSLEQYVIQEFTKLHLLLHDWEQKLLQQLKNNNVAVLKQKEENLECTKHDAVVTSVKVPTGSLEFRKEITLTLEEMKENAENIKSDVTATCKALYDKSEPIKQKTVDILTVPESFEDLAVMFSEEEWKMLRKQDKELHREVMIQNYETLISVGHAR
ncbi:nuclear factor 7, brain-like [Protopterus annectens]|uniref:nuclear factor 7, brain-like n=1 Tax=Protopterus annectens TaxID=7888 RepID=UPI001CF9C9AF|nr:nuclear factor 7, brain-like [Protopterus annectens]XP_043942446.1 nuclear factor 7, brain-like [Protopterus annectens]